MYKLFKIFVWLNVSIFFFSQIFGVGLKHHYYIKLSILRFWLMYMLHHQGLQWCKL